MKRTFKVECATGHSYEQKIDSACEIPISQCGACGSTAIRVWVTIIDTLQPAEDQIDQPEEAEGHYHTCQQCDQVVDDTECFCPQGNTINVWCSARCKAAYDL